jgi:aminoglycoside 6'-N-acetyltransferase
MHKPLIIPYRFRSIIDADLPMAERWLKTPEVARWWVHLQSLPGGTQVIDAFIGEPDMLGRGHGSAFLRLLASSLIREGAPLVVIDPDAGNLRARRAFGRAGFAEDAVVEAKQGMVVLMMFGGDAP